VINKMLRDLDQRQNAAAPAATTGMSPASALRHGTASVSFGKPTAKVPTGSRLGLWLGLAALVAATVSAGAWLWWQNESATTRVDMASNAPASASLPASVAAVPASAVPAASAPAGIAAPESDASASASAAAPGAASAMTLRMESSLSARKALDALLSTSAPVAATVTAHTPTPASAAAAPAPVPATPTAPAAAERPKTRTAANPAVTAPTHASDNNTAPAIQRQQQAGGDAIAQAQNLWNTGSHDAAIDLMQQSIAAAERSAKASATPGTANTVLVPLVREMARMQLAEARFGAVWEMLTRLEPLLGNQADLWAIRANVAQRLGRHQDSVHAYMMALQSRPDEQRWLLGTAVSLAALGQTSSAAEMAEKARAVGPVSKDILAYLRQTGVPLRDQ
jgi:hypothetical protein